MMSHRYIGLSFIFIAFIFLTGCLFPDSEKAKNKVPNEEQLESIQLAVENYQKETGGLLPIKTKESDTPLFQKYLIDFSKLKEHHLITDIPGNAFENGGIYQYTIIDPEGDPQVKLIDLRLSEAIRKINVKLDIYRDEHIYPPFGKEIEEGLYDIDYKKLGLKNPQKVVSPYSKENLPIIMDRDGELYIDYRIDLYNALNEYDHNYKNGDDIRYILAENTPFVPVYSLPYTVENGEPVFYTDEIQ